MPAGDEPAQEGVAEKPSPYTVLLSRQARRNLSENLPLDVAIAATETIRNAIAVNPARVRKPLGAAGSGRSWPAMTASVFVCRNLRPREAPGSTPGAGTSWTVAVVVISPRRDATVLRRRDVSSASRPCLARQRCSEPP
jgi:hypothetical protein